MLRIESIRPGSLKGTDSNKIKELEEQRKKFRKEMRRFKRRYVSNKIAFNRARKEIEYLVCEEETNTDKASGMLKALSIMEAHMERNYKDIKVCDICTFNLPNGRGVTPCTVCPAITEGAMCAIHD